MFWAMDKMVRTQSLCFGSFVRWDGPDRDVLGHLLDGKD